MWNQTLISFEMLPLYNAECVVINLNKAVPVTQKVSVDDQKLTESVPINLYEMVDTLFK